MRSKSAPDLRPSKIVAPANAAPGTTEGEGGIAGGTYVLIRDCDFARKAETVDVVDEHPDIDRLRQIKTFTPEDLTVFLLAGVTLTAIELTSVVQSDDPAGTVFTSKIYNSRACP